MLADPLLSGGPFPRVDSAATTTTPGRRLPLVDGRGLDAPDHHLAPRRSVARVAGDEVERGSELGEAPAEARDGDAERRRDLRL